MLTRIKIQNYKFMSYFLMKLTYESQLKPENYIFFLFLEIHLHDINM